MVWRILTHLQGEVTPMIVPGRPLNLYNGSNGGGDRSYGGSRRRWHVNVMLDPLGV